MRSPSGRAESSRSRTAGSSKTGPPKSPPRGFSLATAGYSGTPLPRKLGIRPGWRVALVDAPPGIESTLGPLPDGVKLIAGTRGARELTLWFVLSRRRFAALLPGMVRFGEASGLWICWPKKSSGVATDLSENVLRDAAIAAGLVDFKVCAIDAVWSGLRFNRRS